MTQNNITDIEKAARLMGYEYSHAGKHKDSHWVLKPDGYSVDTFNPRTNKADLVDLECGLSNICVTMNYSMCIATVDKEDDSGWEWAETACYEDYPTKFAARAEAVMSVVSQLYDAKYGKDGE